MNLLDRNFPDELAERCSSYTGIPTTTGAVKESLQRLFEIERQYRSLKLKYKDLEADLQDAVKVLEDSQKVQNRRDQLLKELKQPNRFRLHGE